MNRKPAPKSARSLRVCSASEALRDFFAARPGAETRMALVKLWQHWDMVMGEEITPLARPLGERAGTLLVGAEDNMELQELTFYGPEMLERANSFMGWPHFAGLRLELLQGRIPLYPPRPAGQLPSPPPKEAWTRPEGFGRLLELGVLDADSPAGRCYAAFLAAHEARP